MSAQAIAEQLNSENVLAPSEYKRLCGLNYHSGFKAGTHAKWQAIQVLRIQFIQVLLEANGLAAGKDHQLKGRYDAEKNAVIISLETDEQEK